MTLARRVLVPTILLGVVLAGAVAAIAWDSVRASRALEETTHMVRSATALAYALDDAAQGEDRAILALASLGAATDGTEEARVRRASGRVAELMDALGHISFAPRPAAIWAQLVANRAALAGIRDEVLESARRGDGRSLALGIARWRLMTTRGDALLKDFAGYHLRFLDRTVAALQEGRAVAVRATVLAALLGLLVAAGLAVAVGRAVVRPIVAVAHAADRIAATGKLSQVAGSERSDEIGTLARAFNRMTERLFAANARLEESDRRKNEFLGMLSHELRNPLAPLRSALYVLDRSDPASPEAARARGVMTRQVAQLTRLVDDLLDVTRIARGKIELRRGAVDVGEILRQCGEDHAGLMRARGHELRVEAPAPGELPVHGDGARLAQVVGNLLQNAAKFTPAGGLVTLAARRDGDVAEIRVRDTGPGIPPHLLPRLFEPFTQAEQTLARSDGGLGLGLSLVKGIVELHGGTVEVEPPGAAPGAAPGAEFVIRLPAAPARLPDGSTPAA